LSSFDEAALVETIRVAFGSMVAPGAWGFSDDCAMMPPVVGNRSRVVTTDVAVEGVDFDLALYPAMYAGYRALAQNVSDVVAKGAVPVGFVWSLAIPPHWLEGGPEGGLEGGLVAELAKGAAVLSKLRTVPLFGGDLSSTSGPLVISVTAWGDVEGLPCRRAGARAGDELYVSGPLGASAAGLRRLRTRPAQAAFDGWLRGLSADEAACVRAHITPLPADPRELVDATAAMDVSDGLLLDASRLARASGLRVELDPAGVDAAIAPGATREDALAGGEDYVLLFAAPPRERGGSRVRGFRIGTLLPGEGVWEAGKRLEPRGFDHFRG
jgi:thiamine-monophosphate kinase